MWGQGHFKKKYKIAGMFFNFFCRDEYKTDPNYRDEYKTDPNYWDENHI